MRLTLFQLKAMLDGVEKYVERPQRRFSAAMTANLVNCWVKKSVTVGQLLGEEEAEPEMSEEERMVEAHRIAEKVMARCNGKSSTAQTTGEASESSVPKVEEEISG